MNLRKKKREKMKKLLLLIIFLKVSLGQIPKSPFGLEKDICNNVNGRTYDVSGFTGTPYVITPFIDTFKNPAIMAPKYKTCRTDSHCMFSYEIDVYDTQLRPFDNAVSSCKNYPGTWFLTYNGQIPGPTIMTPVGHETLLRFNNKIGKYFTQSFSPCNTKTRRGRPFSVHFHGSASLAPFDGWAEDETCFGETKDYIYPNNRPVTGWYHDHALHITARNAYNGMSAYYFVTSKKKFGGCGEPWNLEDIEERHLVFSDRVLDKTCQSFMDTIRVHKDNFYGDINLVSGIPFPNIPIDAKWYRFRLLNSAISRPYLVKIKDMSLNDISQDICWVIAGDGGYKGTPTRFPKQGLLMGVAERYEIVCDFRKLAGQTLFLWNDRDSEMMKDVPYFCYSHLLGKILISRNVQQTPSFEISTGLNSLISPLTKVLENADIEKAYNMISQGKYHRTFKFGRSGGQWTINGETWDTMRIAASDIGQNTWELWLFETGGGWFHPVHIHLVDFYILKREGAAGLTDYEQLTPKDVFYLGPGNKVWTIARFGAHKGDYMFHCHNLIHEDDDMMRAMRMVDGGMNAQTAERYVLNPIHKIIYNNWRYTDPMLGETSAKPTKSVATHNLKLIVDTLNKNLYRIFYPTGDDVKMYNGYENPWQSRWCPV